MGWMKIRKPLVCHCGKSDWCLVSEDSTKFLCMRVQSSKPVPFKDGSIGYIHMAEGVSAPMPYVKPEKKREVPMEYIRDTYNLLIQATEQEWHQKLADNLGVSLESVKAIGAAWSTKAQAWAFPMRDGSQDVVGIRLRGTDGKKWAVYGSRNALFIPKDDYLNQTAYLVEGPTDTCAGHMLGLKAIGRPSCSAGVPDILEFIKVNHIRKLVIIADNDKPGLDGAEVLAHHLPIDSLTLTLPVKDLRAFVKFGGTAQMLKSLEKSTTWRVSTCR